MARHTQLPCQCFLSSNCRLHSALGAGKKKINKLWPLTSSIRAKLQEVIITHNGRAWVLKQRVSGGQVRGVALVNQGRVKAGFLGRRTCKLRVGESFLILTSNIFLIIIFAEIHENMDFFFLCVIHFYVYII